MAERMMTTSFVILAAGLFAAALFMPSSAGAIEVKKHLPVTESAGGGGGGGGSAPNPMSKAQQQALSDAVSTDSEQYVDAESEKKSSGDPYVDLEHAKPHIFPDTTGATVTVKLEADEYKAKGKKAGDQKALVFKYKSQGSKYVLDGEPKWEDVAAKSAKSK